MVVSWQAPLKLVSTDLSGQVHRFNHCVWVLCTPNISLNHIGALLLSACKGFNKTIRHTLKSPAYLETF